MREVGMSLLWKTVVGYRSTDSEPDDRLQDWADHSKHAPSPWLAKAGIGESPCAGPGCSQRDQDFADAMDRADEAHFARQGEFKMHAKDAKIHGFEHRINDDTVEEYRDRPPKKKTLPKTFGYAGKTHIYDGHHRFVADRLAGRDTPSLHVEV